MMKELRRPTPEALMLQRDLEKAKESLRQEQTLGNAAKQQLEKRLQEEVRHSLADPQWLTARETPTGGGKAFIGWSTVIDSWYPRIDSWSPMIDSWSPMIDSWSPMIDSWSQWLTADPPMNDSWS